MTRKTRSDKGQARRKRTPFGVARLKLSLDDDTLKRLEKDDLVPRWINDEDHGSRIRNAIDGGYEFVESSGAEEVGGESVETDRRIKKLVGSNHDGSPKYAFLMAIPRKFYEEDSKAKEENNKLVDDAIRGGTPAGLKSHGIDPSKGGTYVKDVQYKP